MEFGEGGGGAPQTPDQRPFGDGGGEDFGEGGAGVEEVFAPEGGQVGVSELVEVGEGRTRGGGRGARVRWPWRMGRGGERQAYGV